MNSLARNFAYIIIRFRIFFIILFSFITLFFLVILKDLKVNTELKDFLPQGHPFILVHKKLTQIFGGLNQVSIAIEVKEGNILNKDTLAKIIRITNSLYLMEGVNLGRISSISARKVKYVTANEEGFRVERVLRDVPEDEEEIERLKTRIIHNPMVYIRMVSPDLKSTLIQADFEAGVSSRYIFNRLQDIVRKESDENTRIYLAGYPILEGWLDFYLPKMLKILIFTLIVIAGILYLTFRSKRGVLLPLLDSSLATIWSMGMIQLLGFRLDPSTMLVPFLILALGISHSVHFMKRYYEEMKDRTKTSPQAVKNSIESLFLPGITSVITDSFGFLSLLLIPLVTIKSMAAVCGLGVLFNFPASFIFTPAILSFMKRPRILEVRREEKHTWVDKILKRISYMSINKIGRVWIIFMSLWIASLGITGLNRIVIGDNQAGSSYLYPRSPYNQAEKFINENFGGTNSYYILVEGPADSIADWRVLKKMDSLQNYLQKNVEEVGYSVSLADYIKGLNFAMYAGDSRYLTIPENNATIAEYLFLYDISSFPGDFDPVVSSDYAYANIKVELKDHKFTTIKKVIEKTKHWLKNNPDSRVKFLYAGGDIGILGAINEIIKRNIPLNILFISIVVFLYIMLVFHSWKAGLLLLLPLWISVIIIFGIFGFTNTSLTMETLPLASLSMGLGINYGLYVISRMYQEARRRRAWGKIVKEALLTSGKAVFFSGMIVAVGVWVCVFSDIRLQARIGMVLAVALILNMLGSLFLVPALISIFRPKFIFIKDKIKKGG